MDQTNTPNGPSAGADAVEDDELVDILMKVVEARARGDVADYTVNKGGEEKKTRPALLPSRGPQLQCKKDGTDSVSSAQRTLENKVSQEEVEGTGTKGREEGRPGAFAIGVSMNKDDCDRGNDDTATTSSNNVSLQPEQESSSSNTEIAISNAHLVSEPPDEFNNCQVCMVACDGGGGWAACKDLCVPDATFSCQSDTMGKFKTIQEYTDFMAAFGQACPNPTWTTDASSWDGVTHTATFFCTYYCTHTVSVDGVGPSTPTQRSAVSNYCCMVKTDPNRGNRIVHITKVWNDIWMLKELGWITEAIADQNTSGAITDDATATAVSTQVDGTNSEAVATPKTTKNQKKKKSWRRSLSFVFAGKDKDDQSL